MGDVSQLTLLMLGLMTISVSILGTMVGLFFHVNKQSESLRQELGGRIDNGLAEVRVEFREGLAESRVEFRESLAEARLERAELRKDISRVEVNVARIAGHVLGVEDIKNAMTENEATEDEAA